MFRIGLSPKSLSGIAPCGVLPLLSLLPAQRPLRSIPQGPPAPHKEMRMHLLGHKLVPFGQHFLLGENRPSICLTQPKCSFSGSREARAPGRQLPELACIFLSSVPAASPVVLPPAKSLLFMYLAGGITSGSAKLLLSGGSGCRVWFMVYFQEWFWMIIFRGPIKCTTDGADLQKEGVGVEGQ